MGRPKGHRLSEESKEKISAGKKRGWLKWRKETAGQKNPRRYGGRPPGAQPDRKGPIPREHARTPQEKIARKDQMETGASIVSERFLKHPTYKVRGPDEKPKSKPLKTSSRNSEDRPDQTAPTMEQLGIPRPPAIDFDWMDDHQIDASDPQEPAAIIASLHYHQRRCNQLTSENLALRAKLAKSLGFLDTQNEEESEAAREIKTEVVQAMRDMLPQAKRAAKRGKPALLRLIVRTIRTKL